MIGIVGIGKIGSLIATKLTENNYVNKKDLLLCVRRYNKKRELEDLGYKVTVDLNTLMIKSDVIILAIKPQDIEGLIPFITKIDFKDKCIISALASVTIDYLTPLFKNGSIYRIMPNIAMEYNMSNTTIAYTDEKYLNLVSEICENFGKTYIVKENEMDYLTPLNGSVVAYLALFAKDFIDEAKKLGLDYEVTKGLMLDSIISSATLLKNSNQSLEAIIKEVCSKGGITIAGLTELYKNGFDDSIKACYEACIARNKDLKK